MPRFSWQAGGKAVVSIQTHLVTEDDNATARVLQAINSPTTLGGPQPSGGICASPVLGKLCSGPLFSECRVQVRGDGSVAWTCVCA